MPAAVPAAAPHQAAFFKKLRPQASTWCRSQWNVTTVFTTTTSNEEGSTSALCLCGYVCTEHGKLVHCSELYLLVRHSTSCFSCQPAHVQNGGLTAMALAASRRSCTFGTALRHQAHLYIGNDGIFEGLMNQCWFQWSATQENQTAAVRYGA